MSLTLWLVVATVLVAVGVPLASSARELLAPRDREPLDIDPGYSRDPRHFGHDFRARFSAAMTELPARADEWPAHFGARLAMGSQATLHVCDGLPAEPSNADLVVCIGAARVGKGERLHRLYAMSTAQLGEQARLEAVAVDGDCEIGTGVTVSNWIDVERDCRVLEGVDLGLSASAGGQLQMGPGCRFQRLWGLPVTVAATDDPEDAETPGGTIAEAAVYARNSLSLPPGARLEADLVAYADVVIGRGCHVQGSIKAHGDVTLERGCRVDGSVFAQGRVQLGADVVVEGNVRAELGVRLGRRARVGSVELPRSVVTPGAVSVQPGASVHGWILAEGGGTT